MIRQAAGPFGSDARDEAREVSSLLRPERGARLRDEARVLRCFRISRVRVARRLRFRSCKPSEAPLTRLSDPHGSNTVHAEGGFGAPRRPATGLVPWSSSFQAAASRGGDIPALAPYIQAARGHIP